MISVIPVHEAKVGSKYRLFPNKKRSRYLEVKAIANGDKIIFEHHDPIHNITKIIDNVELTENLIRVA